MICKLLPALLALGATACAASAQASTLYFSLGGDGNVNVSGTLTIGPDPYVDTTGLFGTPGNVAYVSPTAPNFQSKVDPANALAVTDVAGTFSDATLGIVGATITGLVATNPQPHYDPDYTIPYSFGWYPGVPATTVSYDNLFYAGSGAPLTCLPTPTEPTYPGGYFDNYGVMFSLSNGDVVDMYSNGGDGGPIYGVVVFSALTGPDYTSAAGLTLNVPEPSTWAMMGLGFAALGFAGYHKSRKAGDVAA
jgi:hypothetical protein